MADVFLSYTREDIKNAELIAQLFEKKGFTVWWDRQMPTGGDIRDVVKEQLEKAWAVVVLWSPRSVKSRWVLGEADKAYELAADKLVPIKIDECELPIDYRAFYAPAVYKPGGLRAFAEELTNKYRTAQQSRRGATAEPSTATKIEFSDNEAADFLSRLAAQKTAFDSEIPSTLIERYRLIKKYPLGAMPKILLTILFLICLPFTGVLFASGYSITTTAVASAILAGLGFAIYTTYHRGAGERWIDVAKENLAYLFGLLFAVSVFHIGQAYIEFGVGSVTFVAFVILGALAAIGIAKYG